MNTTAMIFALSLTFIYTFLILYYRRSFRNFIIYQFEQRFRPDIKHTLSKIRVTVQAYIGGLGLVMIILTVLNSIGLLIIGVEYAVFWGALAGLLAVIPYVGTMIGGLLPALYSLSTSDNPYQPIIILIYYGFIQQIEGNLITPKIVGNKVDINPLFAILSVIFLGTFWGIGGIVLALPLISILRIILDQFEETKPIAMLMSAKISEKPGQFKKLADS
jgi:predicted PurR-regulated permease PerM